MRTVVFFALLCAAPGWSQNVVFQPSATSAIAETLEGASAVAVGDVNGDGRPDLVVGAQQGLFLLLGTGAGRFEPARQLLTGFSGDSVLLADFDRDGKLDLVAYAGAQKTVYVLKGAGNGTFGAPLRLSTLEAPQGHVLGAGMIAADLNQDGVLDLVAEQGTSVALFFGKGDGTFEPCIQLTAGERPTAVAAADLNGDGLMDLVVSNLLSANVTVLLGSGRGAFRAPANIALGMYATGVALADFNKDGKADLAVSTQSDVEILLGNGDGTFRKGATIPNDASPLSIVAGDLNGDGFPDLVVGDYYGGVIDILLGNGDGSFRAPTRLSSLGDVPAVVLADLNRDSKLDLVAASHSAGTAMVALGTGDGRLSQPAHFGVATNSFLRTFNAGRSLLVAVPLRKSVFLFSRGSTPMPFPGVDDYPVDAQAGDFNGDRITDLVVATVRTLAASTGEDLGCRLLVFPGLAGGDFGAPIATAIARCPAASFEVPPLILAAGKFTGGASLDLAVANNAAGAIQVYRGRGDGTFELASESTEGPISSLVGVDFDGDGIQDLAAARVTLPAGPGSLAAYFSSSGGRLSQPLVLGDCARPWNVTAADFTGDSRPDLSVACGDYTSPTEVSVFVNEGSRTFRAAPKIALPFSVGRALLTAADFDGDGKQDLLVLEAYAREGNPWANAGLLLLSNGDGTFRSAGALGGLKGPVAVAAGSWDDDGRPDLAVLGATSGAVALMRNALAAGVPREIFPVSAASFLPGAHSAESIAAAFGQALSGGTESAQAQPLPTQLADVTVSVADSAGQARSAGLFFVSPAQINFLMPAGTAPGAAVVTVSRDGSVAAQALVLMAIAAPGVFTANADGKGVPAAQALHVKPDGGQVTEAVYRCGDAPGSCATVPIDLGAEPEQVYLVLYGTGIRNCNYANVRIGGIDAIVTFAGPQPTYAGLDQVNVLLPRQLAGRGDTDVVLFSCGRTANTVRINLK